MSLYEDLQAARPAERQAVAGRLTRGMEAGDAAANEAYFELCEQVIIGQDGHETAKDASLPRWEFPAANSALLVRNRARVRGFLQAITRAPQASTIIDAGCGSSVLLAAGAANAHPRAEIIAYEINPVAAQCARAMVDLLGLSDRICVETADIFTADLPEVDLAVTETFASGLTVEPGTKIAAALARVAREILPHRVRLYATDQPVSPRTEWQPAATLNLREPHDYISGQLLSTGAGQCTVSVYADYFDARDAPVLIRQYPDRYAHNLTNVVCLGRISVEQPGTPVVFRYESGAELHLTPAGLAIGHTLAN
jgi:hypothetical protein